MLIYRIKLLTFLTYVNFILSLYLRFAFLGTMTSNPSFTYPWLSEAFGDLPQWEGDPKRVISTHLSARPAGWLGGPNYVLWSQIDQLRF